MAEEPGSKCLFLSDGLAISEGISGVNEQVVMYGPDIARGGSSPQVDFDAVLVQEDTAQSGPDFASTTATGYFETSDTPEEFYQDGGDNDGMFNNGVVDQDTDEAMYLYVHHSTSTDEWSFGIFYWGGDLGDVASKTIIGNSGTFFDNPGNPVVEDDTDDGGNTDFYGTDSNGDGFAANRVGGGNGDGAVWTFPPGDYTITVKYREHPNYTEDDGYIPIEQIRFRGPDDTVVDSVPDYGNNYSYGIDVP